ncbi:MAG: transcriptional repressor [Anaerolineae bacterium]|nr:transcriptional repressor [Anaerolineae bacterium]
MKSAEDMVALFRQQGLKITPQRRAIFETLAEGAVHPSAEEVYRRVQEGLPDISRMTVYNTLRELVALGELVEVEDVSSSAMRYDTETGNHHHLFCLGCHALVDVDQSFEALELPQAAAAGYRIVRHQVTFYGYCPTCQKSNPR